MDIETQFINAQKLLARHDSPGFPYFSTGSRFEVMLNSVDIVVFPVASSPTTGTAFGMGWVTGEITGLFRLLDTAAAAHPPTMAPAVKIAARTIIELDISL